MKLTTFIKENKTKFIKTGIYLMISIILTFMFMQVASSVIEGDLLTRLDHIILTYIYRFRSSSSNLIMLAITNLGSKYTLIILSVIVVFILIRYKHIKESIFFSSIFVTTAILNISLKYIFKIQRPNVSPLQLESSYSFPSGHAMLSLVFYLLLVSLIFKLVKKRIYRIYSLVISLALIPLIGFSRLYLGVHYPSDILGGYIAGLLVLIIGLLIEQVIILLYSYINYIKILNKKNIS